MKKSKFFCQKCNYSTDYKSNFDKHLKTPKHLGMEKKRNIFKCECGRTYKFHSGLWRHKAKCHLSSNSVSSEMSTLVNENIELKKIMIQQMSCIKEQQDQIGELIPKVGNNNNNQFNINVFLNEECKNALCINDFINSLQVEIKDLDLSCKRGLSYSIKNMMISGLKQLKINERPIHCTNNNNNSLYIKDEESWEYDIDNTIINKSIENVANKQRQSINKWIDAHPKWEESEEETKQYLEMVKSLMEDVNNNSHIIKSLADETEIK